MITLPNEPYTYGTRTEIYRWTQHDGAAAVKVLRTSRREDLAELKAVSNGAGGA